MEPFVFALIINKFMFYETYTNLDDSRVDKIEDKFPFDKLFDYILSLNIPYEAMEKFVTMESGFASLTNIRYDDDPDNLEIVFDKEGNIVDLYCWTELLGRTYSVKDYGIKWKEYEKTEADLKREAEQEKRMRETSSDYLESFKTYIQKLTDTVVPTLVVDEVTVTPITSLKKEEE